MKQKNNFIFSVYQFNILINKENIVKDTKVLFIKNKKNSKTDVFKKFKKIFFRKRTKCIDIEKYNLYN